MQDTFGEPIHIEVLTDDTDVMQAVWQLQNEAQERGDNSFQVTQLLQRSFPLAEVHQVWVLFNDLLKSAAFLSALYTALRPIVKPSKRLEIRLDAALKIERDQLGKFAGLGVLIKVVKQGEMPDTVPEVPTLEGAVEQPSLPDGSKEA